MPTAYLLATNERIGKIALKALVLQGKSKTLKALGLEGLNLS